MDEKYIKIALNEAKKAFQNGEVPVGAVVVLNNKIISKAYNMKNSTGIVTKHAEILAIEKANKKVGDWRLDNATIYVTLEPCPMCASAIQQSRFYKIVFCASSGNSNNYNIIEKIINDDINNHFVIIEQNIDYKLESEKLITDFFKKIR